MSKSNLAYVGSKPGDKEKPDKNEWRTPEKYINAVKQVLGNIDLDPFSSYEANQLVGAWRIFSKEHSALTNSWPILNTAFANPPFGRSLMPACVDAWSKAYLCGNFNEGILLCNNATETDWFGVLLEDATALCLLDHRIAFKRPNGTVLVVL